MQRSYAHKERRRKAALFKGSAPFRFQPDIYASDEDIPLRFKIEQSSYKTKLLGFNGTITITVLDYVVAAQAARAVWA